MADRPPEPPDSPDIRTIRQLVRLMHRFDLTAVDLINEQTKIRLRRRSGEPVPVSYVPSPVPAAPAPPPAAPTSKAPAAAEKGPEAASGVFIRSPMVGTFYASPAPDSPPFVTAGAPVRPDSVVCVIEAMKVFTDINAGVGGTVAEVLVKNGQPVEFDQPLFRVEPA